MHKINQQIGYSLDGLTIHKFQRVLMEPESSTEVDSVLTAYNEAIYPPEGDEKRVWNGAILLCVVGGKMSEGINFKDDLARYVTGGGNISARCH